MKRIAISLLLAASALLLSSCIAYRAVCYGSPGIDDYRAFPQDTIRRGGHAFTFAETPHEERMFDTLRTVMAYGEMRTISDALAAEKKLSCGVLLIRNDSIIFEHYQGKIGRSDVSTVFSISKSLTALLCGIAVDEGFIRSVHDPVTEYIPELRDADPRFARLTVEHLLDMRAGLKFKENYSFNPFSGMARLHYGRNMLRQMQHLKFKEEPGTSFEYSSMVTAILGIVIERATGRTYADYMSEKVWRPLGMENDAMMSVNAVRIRHPHAYGGISTTARDLAKVGRLYMNRGDFDGRRIVDSAWVDTTFSVKRAHANSGSKVRGYSYSWWRDMRKVFKEDGTMWFENEEAAMRYCKESGIENVTFARQQGADKCCVYRREGMFNMVGMLGQTVYVDPSRNVILVILTNRDLQRLAENIFDRL